ncbi:MotA/TolQ/ExbB proton channel family protein [bacterium]|nr:MotA/TolQ/ExbB proton channel family protein [bacterium]
MKFNRIANGVMLAVLFGIIAICGTLAAQAPAELDSIWLHTSDAKWEKTDEGFNLTMSWELYIKKAQDKKGSKFSGEWTKLSPENVEYTYRVEVATDSVFSQIDKTQETNEASLVIRDLNFDKFYTSRVRIVDPPVNYRDDFAAGTIYKHEKETGGKSEERKGVIGFLLFAFDKGGWQTYVIIALALLGILGVMPITWYRLRLANIFPPNKPGFLYSALPFDRTGKCDHLSPKGNVFVREVAKYWSRAMAAMASDPSNWESTDAFIKATAQEQEEVKKRRWIEEGLPAIEQAIDVCKNGVPGIKLKKKPLDYPFPRVLLAALENQRINRNNWWASQEMDRAVENTSFKEIDDLKGWSVTAFWALGSVEPMLGLFGTVEGIQKAFMKIQEQLKENPDAPMADTIENLAGGIHQALITTFFGLLFGIPFMMIYYYYRGKADWVFSKWEEIVIDLLNRA